MEFLVPSPLFEAKHKNFASESTCSPILIITHIGIAVWMMLLASTTGSVCDTPKNWRDKLRITCDHFVREHDVRVLSTGFANRVRHKPSPVDFFDNHKGCPLLSGYGVRLNFCSLPCLQDTPTQGPVLVGDRYEHTRGSRCWYYVFFPWPIDRYPLWGPGVGCRWQRPDHSRMAEPKGKVER